MRPLIEGLPTMSRRADQLARVDPVAERELARVPLHPANGGDAVRHVHHQHVLGERRRAVGARQVSVHFSQPRDQEASLAGDDR